MSLLKLRAWTVVLAATAVVLSRPVLAIDQADGGGADQAEVEALPTDEAEALSGRVGGLLRDLVGNGAKLEDAKGDDRELIFDQMVRDREAILDTLPKLLEELSRLRAEKVDVSALDKKVEGHVNEILAQIRRGLPVRKRRIRELRADLDEVAPEERLESEGELTRQNDVWDQTLGDFLTVADMKKELGADPSKDYRFLSVELAELAELRAGQLRILARRLDNTLETSTDLQGDAAQASADKVARIKRESERAAASLTTVLELMEERDIDTADYRLLLVETTGEISRGSLNAGVLARLLRDGAKRMLDSLRENGPGAVLRLVLFLAIIFVFRLLASLARRLVERGLARSDMRFSKLLNEFFVSTSYRLVLLFGFLIALSQLGIEVAPLLTGLGVAGFIVGFALQDTLSNFASGLMILAYRPFDVGDIVEAAGVSGIVDQLTLVSTTIRTFDNQRLIVPNTKIWGDVIINVTAERIRRVDLVFGIGYGDDIERAERVLSEIVAAHELILDDPAPTIRLHNLNESSVDFVVRPWTQTKDYWSVYWDLTREVKRRFDAEGISIPFPQRDVHLIGGENLGGAVKASD